MRLFESSLRGELKAGELFGGNAGRNRAAQILVQSFDLHDFYYRTEAMDMTWITDRIAVGGGIWNEGNMQEVARQGITHIINMQVEFDDRRLAEPFGIDVLWNPVDDDFMPKPPQVFRRGVDFALAALDEPGARLFIHCAAGVHRAPMMTLAILRALGWTLEHALDHIQAERPVVDWADIYVWSVEEFIRNDDNRRTGSAEVTPDSTNQ
jgi:protein-tyrosine phosphatase